ncbi:hypothetical protein PFISCL1PPCAC_2684, partial [Pristionchus fissidentatus]
DTDFLEMYASLWQTRFVLLHIREPDTNTTIELPRSLIPTFCRFYDVCACPFIINVEWLVELITFRLNQALNDGYMKFRVSAMWTNRHRFCFESDIEVTTLHRSKWEIK